MSSTFLPLSNRLSTFSSVGPNTDGNIKPDILAVGGTISTAQPLSMNGGFVVESGTSFSSPTVAGAAALLKAARPGLTAQQYRSLLINSAAPFHFSSGAVAAVQQTGTGLLNMSADFSDCSSQPQLERPRGQLRRLHTNRCVKNSTSQGHVN